MQLQANKPQGLPAATRSQERGTEWILLQSLQKEWTLLTPGFQTSVPQNCERVSVGFFKSPSLWQSAVGTLANQSLYNHQSGFLSLSQERCASGGQRLSFVHLWIPPAQHKCLTQMEAHLEKNYSAQTKWMQRQKDHRNSVYSRRTSIESTSYGEITKGSMWKIKSTPWFAL